MNSTGKNRPPRVASQMATLRLRLEEAEATIHAIRHGEVDAVVVAGQLGDQVFTLDGAGEAYRALIESMHEGALTLTLDATILYANSCFARMIRSPLEEVIGSSFRRFLSVEDWATLQPHVLQPAEAGTKTQVTLDAGDGLRLPAQLSLRPLAKDGLSGATVGVVVTDMTEAHRIAQLKETEGLYAQAVEHGAELERRVEERTRQLQHANQELEAFESSVSHDLRAPLRHVMGFSEMLLEEYATLSPEMVQKYLTKIRDGAGKMEGLIDALLEFSRAGKGALSRVAVDMGEMWRNVLSEIKPESGDRLVDVAIGDLPPCHADPILLRQVVVNLLGNALKYSSSRDRSIIEVSGRVEPEEGGPVYAIKDNGIGFDMKHAEKLFAVFERLPNAGEFEGTGVGLTTVQRIVQRHGGRIWAESIPNLGATFFFTVGAKTIP